MNQHRVPMRFITDVPLPIDSEVFKGKVEISFDDGNVIMTRGDVSLSVPADEIDDLIKFIKAAAEILK